MWPARSRRMPAGGTTDQRHRSRGNPAWQPMIVSGYVTDWPAPTSRWGRERRPSVIANGAMRSEARQRIRTERQRQLPRKRTGDTPGGLAV